MNVLRTAIKPTRIAAIALATLSMALATDVRAQNVARPPCNWMDVGPERLQFDNPGKVTAGPLLNPGTHTVWVAVKQNDPLRPYSGWTPSGPFEVKAGKKYLVTVRDGTSPVVAWTEEPSRLGTYSNPGGMGAVYFANATASDKFYGIAVCLGGGGPGAGVKIAMTGFRFGITLDNGKRLTYSSSGSTNTTVVKVDGQTTEFGNPNGKVVEPFAPLPNGGVRCTWIMKNVRFTQLLEPVTSQSGARDTVMVRWLIRNEDAHSHEVGLRLQLDTLIGQNDGVPFTVPGLPGLVTTTADFPKQGPIPHFIQALEVANLQYPGTVAHLSLKLGGRIEAPGRVSLSHWPGGNLNWDIPVSSLTGDSAAILYWPESPLQPNQEREIGFSYGLGSVKSSEGRIGATTVAQAQTGHEFPITAYIKDPAPNETLTLEPPAGIQVVGATTVAVPPLPEDSKDRTSLVTWKAKAERPGNFEVVIRSSTGIVQLQPITVARGPEPVRPADADIVQKLIQQLQDQDEIVRLRAAKELGKLAAAAAAALPALQNATNDKDEDVRRVAANSIRAIQAALTAGPSEQVERRISELASPDVYVRLKAAKELGKQGAAARQAIPALQKLLEDPDLDVRRVADNAIERIQGSVPPPKVASVSGTSWSGTESLAGFGKLTFQFEPDAKAFMTDVKSKVAGKWSQTGNQVAVTFSNCVYSGTIQGQTFSGTARYTAGDATWTFNVTRESTATAPPLTVTPATFRTRSNGESGAIANDKPWPEHKFPPAILVPQRR